MFVDNGPNFWLFFFRKILPTTRNTLRYWYTKATGKKCIIHVRMGGGPNSYAVRNKNASVCRLQIAVHWKRLPDCNPLQSLTDFSPLQSSADCNPQLHTCLRDKRSPL
jgi:hypothetical protein